MKPCKHDYKDGFEREYIDHCVGQTTSRDSEFFIRPSYMPPVKTDMFER